MKHKYIFFILFVLSYYVYANDNDLLNEYKLLCVDISNIRTVSYKSHFNKEYNKAYEKINVSQGSLLMTEVPSDVAIVGEGYFKIRLEDDTAGWTRAGSFNLDSNGNIIVNQKYYLYDNINLLEMYFPESLRITNDGNIYVSIRGPIEEKNNIIEIHAGQLIIYNIPGELLIRYNDVVYIINDNAEYIEKLSDSKIFQGGLEMSNVPLLPVALRMYYILSVINESYISNIELKKELLKVQIERMTGNYLLEDLLFSINSGIDRIEDILIENYKSNTENDVESNNVLPTLEQILKRGSIRRIHNIIPRFDAQRLMHDRLYYLISILPYLEYDY
jgi:flagellar basal body rod protein FlgF